MTNGNRIRYKDNINLAEVIRCPYPADKRPCDQLLEERDCQRCKEEWLEKEEEV